MNTWQYPQWNFSTYLYTGVGLLLLIAAAPLLIRIPLPYEFYTFLRIAVCGSTAVLAYQNFNVIDKPSIWAWLFLLIAILFNPFKPIILRQETWFIVNIVLGLTFLLLAYQTKSTKLVVRH